MFDDDFHAQTLSEDGTYTAYSKEYNEHYHSTKDGALQESFYKHVIPASKFVNNKESITILDICYGLGFNTLATLLYYKKYFPQKKVHIYSPELDASLVKSLVNFPYPKEFKEFRSVIEALSTEGYYSEENFSVEIFIGDAREYIKNFEDRFDIVYQDAFSPSTNPILWTREYFADIKKSMHTDGVLTTYSTAFKTRLALYENGFMLYLNRGDDFRPSTVASLSPLEFFEVVDMEHKISCNRDVKSLRDADV